MSSEPEGISYTQGEKTKIAHILLDSSNPSGPQISMPILPNWVSKHRLETKEKFIITFQNEKHPKWTALDFIRLELLKKEFTSSPKNVLAEAKSFYNSFSSAYKIIDFSGFKENNTETMNSVSFLYSNYVPRSETKEDINYTVVLAPTKNYSGKYGPLIITYQAGNIEDVKLRNKILKTNIPIINYLFRNVKLENI